MLKYPEINPILYKYGNLSLHWYGLMYVLGLAAAFSSCYKRRDTVTKHWNYENISDLISYLALGIILGGRIGYLLLYEPDLLIQNPLSLIYFWQPGRSFHGGLLGVIAALFIFCKVHKYSFWKMADYIVPAVPIGLGFGRLGNFINGELWGRITTMPQGMVFPHAGPLPRHPSQLYECFLEGVLLYIILWAYSSFIPKNKQPLGALTGIFLMCYGLVRFLVEFFREPDIQLGFLNNGWMTMGQLLSFPMIIVGLYLLRSKNATVS